MKTKYLSSTVPVTDKQEVTLSLQTVHDGVLLNADGPGFTTATVLRVRNNGDIILYRNVAGSLGFALDDQGHVRTCKQL
jgi:hypothetical protein